MRSFAAFALCVLGTGLIESRSVLRFAARDRLAEVGWWLMWWSGLGLLLYAGFAPSD